MRTLLAALPLLAVLFAPASVAAMGLPPVTEPWQCIPESPVCQLPDAPSLDAWVCIPEDMLLCSVRGALCPAFGSTAGWCVEAEVAEDAAEASAAAGNWPSPRGGLEAGAGRAGEDDVAAGAAWWLDGCVALPLPIVLGLVGPELPPCALGDGLSVTVDP